jgi:hypothetical protein
MSLYPHNLRRCAICIPSLVPDRELAQGVAMHFGNRPTCVAAVSTETYQVLHALLKNCIGPAAMGLRLGACRPDPSGSVGVVLALQLGVRQVRCIAPLEDASLRALLVDAADTGLIQLALGPHRGSVCTVFDVTVPVPNVRSVLDIPMEPAGLERQAQAVEMTAAMCQRLGEVPSLVAGWQVEAVDVTVVHVGGSPFSLDAEARSHVGRAIEKAVSRN